MPAPDLITLRKLAIVKQVYFEGGRQRARATPVARLLAIVDYDLAIETALKVAIRALDPRVGLKGDFPTIINVAKDALSKASLGELPQAGAIQHVRDVRNAAQHEGRLPTPEEESECHVIARAFLDELLSRVWGQSIDTVGVGDLVLDEQCKRYLDEAQASFSAGEHASAIAKAAEALEWALVRVKNALVGRGDTWVRAILTEDSFGKPKASRDLTRSIERTQETVLYVALGLDYGDYARFKSIAGSLHFKMGGGADHYGAKVDPDQSDAEQALAYASEAIIQIEARVGSIDKPFGQEYWY